MIINVGDGDTAHTGGGIWENPAISAAIREFVYNGGGFIGVGEPSGHQFQGITCQLADMLGVEKETGFTLNYDKYNWEEHPDHFILADTTKPVDFGEGKKNIFAYEDTEILVQREKEVQMAVHEFGKGAVFISAVCLTALRTAVFCTAVFRGVPTERRICISGSVPTSMWKYMPM